MYENSELVMDCVFSLFIDSFKINQRTYSEILKSHKIKHNFIILNGLKFINQSLLFILQHYHFKYFTTLTLPFLDQILPLQLDPLEF